MQKLTSIFYLNEIGKRDNLEDSIFPLSGQASIATNLFIVCDGVGGLNKGEIASRIVCQTMGQALEGKSKITNADIESAKDAAIRAMADYQRKHDESKSMATTLTLAALNPDSILLAWCGDSRILQIRDGKIIYETTDHSLVAELVKTQQITAQEARSHPLRNRILRSLNSEGAQSEIEFHYLDDVRQGDWILLCTDGVLENLDELQVERIFTHQAEDSIDAGKAIRDLCYGKTSDNYSMYLIRLGNVKAKAKARPKKMMIASACVVFLALAFFASNYITGKGSEQMAQQSRSATVKEPGPVQNPTMEKEKPKSTLTPPVNTEITSTKTNEPIDQNNIGKDIQKNQDSVITKQGYAGEKSWIHFATDKIIYPDSAKTDSITGTAIVTFTINEQGHPIDFKRKTKLGHGLEDELIRVIQLAKWKPYKFNNVAKSSSHTVFYKFVLPVDQNIKKPNTNLDTQKENQPKENQQKEQN
jgi:PPM family protein phosphatase